MCYYESIRRMGLRDAGTQSYCGAGRAHGKHLAVRQPWNAPNDCVGSQDYRKERIAFWPTLPLPARQGEIRLTLLRVS